MPFFGSRDDPQAPTARAGPQSDLPAHAMERLRELRGEGGRRPLFTSDLSVNEFLLVRRTGFDPIGLVVGSSIYHIGYQQASWNQNQEMTVLYQAMYHASELAMERMQNEAEGLGAEGIVGVQIQERSHGWGSHVIEFFSVGTAVVPRTADHPVPEPAIVLHVND